MVRVPEPKLTENITPLKAAEANILLGLSEVRWVQDEAPAMRLPPAAAHRKTIPISADHPRHLTRGGRFRDAPRGPAGPAAPGAGKGSVTLERPLNRGEFHLPPLHFGRRLIPIPDRKDTLRFVRPKRHVF
jgi:hypothetical protein